MIIYFLLGSDEKLKDEPTGSEAATQESPAAAESCDVPQIKDVNLNTENPPDEGTGLTEHLCSNHKTHIFSQLCLAM